MYDEKELVLEFVVESREGLANFEAQMLAIEAGGTSVDRETVNAAFRTMHTIKGGSGFLAFERIGALAHALEETLDDLRNGRLVPSSKLISTLLRGADFMKGLIEAVESSNDADVAPFVTELEQFKVASGIGAAKDAAGLATASDLVASVRQPAVECETALDSIACDLHSLIKSPTSAADADQLEERRSGAAAPAGSTGAGAGASDRGSSPVADTTIRVDVALLDKLMTRVGELVLARNQILQHCHGLDDAGFVRTAQRLSLITAELQEGVMKTRMQPIGNVWSKFPRVVRDLAAQLGKHVRIDMEGKETELDKTIVEAIKDPLTHLIRNAVDHGIEGPDARSAAGKAAEGVLTLRAYHEGGQVNIEIADDGAGLKLDRIRQRAVERGIVGADHASRLSDRETAQLILLPGFSTAEKVTSVSGRGVGMDVVKTNIERIGGTLDLHNRPGRGMTVKIKIPLTLAIVPALIVTDSGDRYAIPQMSLLELVRLEGEQIDREIESVHGAPVYRLRGKLLPLVDLTERLGLSTASAIGGPQATETPEDRVLNIVVLRANDQQFGLMVDKINDTQEIVVKPLSRQLKSIGEYSGTTIMGDGTAALILDVMGLATAAGLAGELRDGSSAAGSGDEATAVEEKQTLLIVDVGDSRRFALPTSMVARLEKPLRSSVEFADGREVIQYRGAVLPLVSLRDVFGFEGTPHEQASEEMHVVVYSDDDRSCGIVVHRIIDIVETELKFATARSADDLLLGTTVIQQRVTDVLNLPNLAKRDATIRSRFCGAK